MKKTTGILTIAFMTGAALYAPQVTFAEVSNTAGSNNTVNFKSGEGDITNPVDPTDPTNPVVPSPIDPTDPTNPGTGNKGPLSIDYASNIKFGEQKIAGKDMVYSAINKDPFVQVTDTRGTGAGWHLSAAASEFQNADKSKTLKGAELSFKNGQVKATSENSVSVNPTASDVVFSNTSPQLVFNAKAGEGRGTWLNVWSTAEEKNENVQLKVLAGSADADTEYTATIVWELADAPK